MAPEKASSYKMFLLDKCDTYKKHLVRVGSKMMRNGNFDRDFFAKTFLPDKEEILRKIEETARLERRVENSRNCIDSELIEILRPHINSYARDLKEVARNDECCEESNESMTTVIECSSSGDKNERNVNRASNAEDAQELNLVMEELMPGECSKIVVRKTRADIFRSQMDDTDIEGDFNEALYVYRKKKC